MHHYIITGTSRGIGEALAYELIQPDHHLHCLSRSRNEELIREAEAVGAGLSYYEQDLAQTFDAHHLMGIILGSVDLPQAASITLVHNAGVLQPISAMGTETHGAEDLVRNVNVNLLSPMLMTDAFVRGLQEVPIPKRVLAISSGAARRPIHAWSAYCTTKAAMDMHCQCLQLEQQDEEHPIRVASVAPGTVDTHMQEEIREVPQEQFSDVDRFHRLKAEGKLWTPEFVAGELVAFLQSEEFGNEVLLDLRDWAKPDS